MKFSKRTIKESKYLRDYIFIGLPHEEIQRQKSPAVAVFFHCNNRAKDKITSLSVMPQRRSISRMPFYLLICCLFRGSGLDFDQLSILKFKKDQISLKII